MSEGRRHNALKHGVFSKSFLRPRESEKDYARHVDAFVQELQPNGPFETDCVMTIAGYSWRRFRLHFPRHYKVNEIDQFKEILELEARCDVMIDRALKRLLQIRGFKSISMFNSPTGAEKQIAAIKQIPHTDAEGSYTDTRISPREHS